MGNIAVTAMIALTAAAGWQRTMVEAGMSPDAAASTYARIQRDVFLATAHPFLEPSFLDVARTIPGWAVAFTAGFTSAMLVLGAVALAGALVAWLGLRHLPLSDGAAAEPG